LEQARALVNLGRNQVLKSGFRLRRVIVGAHAYFTGGTDNFAESSHQGASTSSQTNKAVLLMNRDWGDFLTDLVHTSTRFI
jgi:hypothetical protein